MARTNRTNDWGFPRWRGYDSRRDPETIRLCDRHGCTAPGCCPAPKAPNSRERWLFCKEHAAEYNRGWDYFAGLTAEEASARAKDEARDAGGYAKAHHYDWAASGDGSRSADEMRALDVFGLEPDADFAAIRSKWRALAKETHPDVKPGDGEAAKRFQAGWAAYEILRRAEESRQYKPKSD